MSVFYKIIYYLSIFPMIRLCLLWKIIFGKITVKQALVLISDAHFIGSDGKCCFRICKKWSELCCISSVSFPLRLPCSPKQESIVGTASWADQISGSAYPDFSRTKPIRFCCCRREYTMSTDYFSSMKRYFIIKNYFHKKIIKYLNYKKV